MINNYKTAIMPINQSYTKRPKKVLWLMCNLFVYYRINQFGFLVQFYLLTFSFIILSPSAVIYVHFFLFLFFPFPFFPFLSNLQLSSSITMKRVDDSLNWSIFHIVWSDTTQRWRLPMQFIIRVKRVKLVMNIDTTNTEQ